MGEMASALAHELNQPLGAVSNYAKCCRRLLDQALSELVCWAVLAGPWLTLERD